MSPIKDTMNHHHHLHQQQQQQQQQQQSNHHHPSNNNSTISRRSRDEFSETGVIIREIEDGVRCEQCKTNCPGFAAHDWRKTCQSCKCPREAHAIYQQQSTSVHERLGFKVVSPADSGVDPRDLGYTWVPQGIRVSSRINRYFEQLPLDKVPKIGSEGSSYREQQISYQLPKQDLSLEHCRHLEDLHEASYEDFVTARNEIALDIGYIKDASHDENCAHCEGEINVGEMVVAAPKFAENVMWHPRCFTCNTCNELLVDLTYCVHDDKIYCERHYAELLKPRCAGCDEEDESEDITTKDQAARSDTNANLQTSQSAEKESSPNSSSASPRLRRSPRIEEMDQYEERWKESNESPSTSKVPTANTPTITVQKPLDFAPWRDEYGLVMEGLSDFYDFTASVNPSRSRSTSRNPSPTNTAPSTPQPKNVSLESKNIDSESHVEIYDDTNQLENNEFTKENIEHFLDSLKENETHKVESNETASVDLPSRAHANFVQNNLQYVIDDHPNEMGQKALIPMVNIVQDSEDITAERTENDNDDMNALVASLRSQRSRSRSRSRSPLPTADNIQRSLETRRHKMIKHNEDILEKLIESKLLPDSTAEITVDTEDIASVSSTSSITENDSLVESLNLERSRSRSRSKSPLPTAANIQRSLETRRNKMIKHNEDILEKLIESKLLPDSSDEKTVEIDGDKNSGMASSATITENCNDEEMNSLVASLRLHRSRSRSRSKSPLPTAENVQRSLDTRRQKMIQHNDDILVKLTESNILPETPEIADPDDGVNMSLLVESLRAQRSRSRSPLPTRSNIPRSRDSSENTTVIEKFGEQMQLRDNSVIFCAPLVSIEVTEPDLETNVQEEDCAREDMDSLIQSLRVVRSRSRSKSPMRLPTAENLGKSLESRRNKRIERNDEIMHQLEERSRTPEPPQLTVEYVYEFVETTDEFFESPPRSRLSRSRSPSRSQSLSPKSSTNFEGSFDTNFHVLLNLEGSQNRTLSKNSEEYESALADRLKQLDEEALDKLKNAFEETELRTLSPLNVVRDEVKLQHNIDAKNISPTISDYDRTISEEIRDIERIKQEMLDKGFKRSTYVGESMDLMGTEYEPLRREAARFQRSKSPTPSFSETDFELGQITAAEKRNIQALVLAELTGSSEMRNTGAIPKTVGTISIDSERSISKEIQDTLRIKEEMLNSGFQRSTYVGQSVDESMELEEMRRQNAEFRRSASKSRSPLRADEVAELADIETEAVKRELQDRFLDEISNTSMSFQDFSRHLNPNFLDNDRRASDSALIQKPEILIQFQETEFDDLHMDPEEYHHFRRFSLAQEQPLEEYPNDDYIFIQQVEVRTRSGSRTWTREDFYSEDMESFLTKSSQEVSVEGTVGDNVDIYDVESETEVVSKEFSIVDPDTLDQDNASNEENRDDVEEFNLDEMEEDEDSNGSEDERRTVIEVDDEIDEDISDFNERGPAEESHHEQSECEEAEREMDHYAGREARDWADAVDVEDMFIAENQLKPNNDEGAVGGPSSSPYDSDSFAIDQIYDEAIKNRKQSGILREFDSILNEITNSFSEKSSEDIDAQYALWSKTHKKPKTVDFNTNFITSELKDTEMRYLGDAIVTERQSTRLRSRYRFNPVLQASTIPDDIEVDMNYKPKREYNWRKNFKLSDDDAGENNVSDNVMESESGQVDWNLDEENEMYTETLDIRKFSLGGESITLFSRSPEKDIQTEKSALEHHESQDNIEVHVLHDIAEENLEKPKKKKTKKKTRKGSKGSVEMLNRDEDNFEPLVYSRRSSSIQMDTDSPKRKSRSRRSSRSSLTNDDAFGLYSPRSSVSYAEPIADIMEEYTDEKESVRPKKIKKRKKVKEIMTEVTEIPTADCINDAELSMSNTYEPTASAVITPDSATANLLSTLSPQESVCVTPGSLDSEKMIDNQVESKEETPPQVTTSSSAKTPETNSVDTFDILKDANFYPLF